ncbi:MAG: hypothetical protein AAFR39_03125 [Pseudomonadota bacterium]
MFENYFGLIEMGFAIIVYGGFIIWQRWSLAKDIREREERERTQAEAELADAAQNSDK